MPFAIRVFELLEKPPPGHENKPRELKGLGLATQERDHDRAKADAKNILAGRGKKVRSMSFGPVSDTDPTEIIIAYVFGGA